MSPVGYFCLNFREQQVLYQNKMGKKADDYALFQEISRKKDNQLAAEKARRDLRQLFEV